MLSVQSFYFSDSYKRFGQRIKKNTPEFTSKVSEVSCNLLNKHGYHSILFIQKENYKFFKHIPYKDIIFFDESDFADLPKDFYSASKLVSIQKLNEPFIHFDLDLFLIKDISDVIKNKDFFIFHSEPWINNSFFSMHRNYIQSILPINGPLISYNAAIIGGVNFDLIKNSAKFILDYISKNNVILDSQLKKNKDYEKNKTWYKSVFLEQVLMVKIILSHLNLNEPTTILKGQSTQMQTCNEMQKHNIIHLWGKFYHYVETTFGVDNFIKKLEKEWTTKNI